MPAGAYLLTVYARKSDRLIKLLSYHLLAAFLRHSQLQPKNIFHSQCNSSQDPNSRRDLAHLLARGQTTFINRPAKMALKKWKQCPQLIVAILLSEGRGNRGQEVKTELSITVAPLSQLVVTQRVRVVCTSPQSLSAAGPAKGPFTAVLQMYHI